MVSVTKSVDVEAPLSTVYNQWTQFEDFPQFMGGVDQITAIERYATHGSPSIGGSSARSLLGSVTVPRWARTLTSKWGQRAVLRPERKRATPGRARCIVARAVSTPHRLPGGQLHRTRNATTVAGASARTRRRHDRAPRRAATPASVRTGWPEQSGHRGWIPTAACHLRTCSSDRCSSSPRSRAGHVPATAGNVAEPTPGQERMHGRWPEPRTPEPAAT